MKTNYTLIHYLSDGEDYCRGCRMGSSSSEFGIFFFNDEESIIKKYTELLVEIHFEKNVFGCHDCTVLINGADSDNSYDPAFDRIARETVERSKALIAAKQIEIEQAAKIKAEKDKELERQRIQNEIAYLQSKLDKPV